MISGIGYKVILKYQQQQKTEKKKSQTNIITRLSHTATSGGVASKGVQDGSRRHVCQVAGRMRGRGGDFLVVWGTIVLGIFSLSHPNPKAHPLRVLCFNHNVYFVSDCKVL